MSTKQGWVAAWVLKQKPSTPQTAAQMIEQLRASLALASLVRK